MSRVFREMEVNGASCWTLFDSGARHNYIARSAAARLPLIRLPQQVERHLGGKTFSIAEACPLVGTVEGYGVTTIALVVDQLFPDEHKRPIEIIIGAEAMEVWGIGIDMANRRLDFTYYAKEATEGCII